MPYLSALTALRFVAAGLIVVHHVQPYFGVGAAVSGQMALDQGVSFFFVLSGFILFYRHGEIAGAAQAWDFVAARVARIWPLHTACFGLLLLFVATPWGPAGLEVGPLAANLLLVQSWIPRAGYFFSYNAVSWSLSTELFFYVCYPLLAAGWHRTWPWKLAICLGSAILAIVGAGRLGLGFYDGSEHLSIDALVYIDPLARVFEFALGMAAAEAWRHLSRPAGRLSWPTASVLEAAALLVAFEAMTSLKDRYGLAFAQGHISAALLKWLVTAGSAPFFAILVLIFAAERGALSHLLRWRPFVVLGEISFALYLCHQLLFRGLTASGSLAAYGGLDRQFWIYLGFALALSYALHRLVERPCQKAMLAWLRGRLRRV